MAAPIVGVDVGGTTTRAVRFDGDLVAVATVAAPTPRGAAAIVEQVTRLVNAVDGAPSAVAVGMPGRGKPRPYGTVPVTPRLPMMFAFRGPPAAPWPRAPTPGKGRRNPCWRR